MRRILAAVALLIGLTAAPVAHADPGQPCTGIAARDMRGCYPSWAQPGYYNGGGVWVPPSGPLIDPACAQFGTCTPDVVP